MTDVPTFSPIAIVGQGLILPGAHTPEELWTALSHGRDLLSVPSDNPAHRLRQAGEHARSTGRGGYVRNFADIFDPTGYGVEPGTILQSDVQLQWLLYAARQALHQAGYEMGSLTRTGLIVGNLGFPTRSLIHLCEGVWLSHQSPQRLQAWGLRSAAKPFDSSPAPELRFMSGYVIQQAAHALGLGPVAYAVDAACASSLYAIDAACQALSQHRVDMMVAGGINAADPLILHKGFSILQAMSPSGRSRPFHKDADGMVPAEGAAVVVLKRLKDAISDRNPILGVIRGIGLSNDGAEGGRLHPAQNGQIAAMAQAYRIAQWRPDEVSLVECHATGAPRGDATEISSLSHIFHEAKEPIPIGSIKSNLGHLVTAAGAAGLIKVLLAIAHQMRPKTLHSENPHPLLAGSPVRLIAENEPWAPEKIRRAAVSSFGFGGTNAHLLVEEFQPSYHQSLVRHVSSHPVGDRPPVAVVALGISQPTSSLAEPPDVAQVHIATDGLKMPPNDVRKCSGQQALALQATLAAVDMVGALPTHTGVYMGTESDPDVARHVVRVHASEWTYARTAAIDSDTLREWQNAWAPPMDAAEVMGVLPNMPANLINQLLDCQGPGQTVSSGPASGLTALALGVEALQDFRVDAAIVGAVDCGAEPIHQWAMTKRFPNIHGSPADGAVVLILERLEDAARQGHAVLDVLTTPDLAGAMIEDVDTITWYATAGLRRWLGKSAALNREMQSKSVPDSRLQSSGIAVEIHLPPVRLPSMPAATACETDQVVALPPAVLPAISLPHSDAFHPALPKAEHPGSVAAVFLGAAQAHQQFLRTAYQQHQQFLKTVALLQDHLPDSRITRRATDPSKPAPEPNATKWLPTCIWPNRNGQFGHRFSPVWPLIIPQNGH